MTEDVGDALDGRGLRNLRQRLAHHFADDELAKVLALQGEGENLVFVDCADRKILLEHWNLRNVLLLHGLQSVENSLVGPRDDELADLAGGLFGVDAFRPGDGGSPTDIPPPVLPTLVI